MPGFEIFGDEERREVQDVLDTGVLFRYGFDQVRKGHWKAKTFESELAKKYRFIALDLPGHGKSEKPQDPVKTYNYYGYANVINEVIQKLNLSKLPIVVGWSLGGNIGYTLTKVCKIAGLLTVGTSPFTIKEGKMDFSRAFHPNPIFIKYVAKEQFTKEEAIEFFSVGGMTYEHCPFVIVI